MTGQFIINVFRGKRTSKRMRVLVFSRRSPERGMPVGTREPDHVAQSIPFTVSHVLWIRRCLLYIRENCIIIKYLLLLICVNGRAHARAALCFHDLQSCLHMAGGIAFFRIWRRVRSAAQRSGPPPRARFTGLANDLSKDLAI